MELSTFMHRLYLPLLILLGWMGVTPTIQAQSISGTITDAETSLPLEGVNIIIAETSQGAASDRNGFYRIDQVTPGTYTLVIRAIGYNAIQETISVEDETTAQFDFALSSSSIHLGEILAQADRPYSTASSSTIRAFDMITRPVRSSQDLLQLTPGLVTAQHAGGGKAEQIFLRGFDTDHGTDIAISVDGMPVNMVSHGHGQGYADLHFLMPEVVERIDVSKGPYDTRFGNLATAGAITFATRDHLDNNLVRLEGGRFNTGKLTALYQIPITENGHQGAYFGGQFYATDGPVARPQGFQRFNLFGKFHTHLSEEAKLSMSVSGFSSAWDASGQIPLRAIENGMIDRFGSIDDLEGGTTGRQDVNLAYSAQKGNAMFKIQGYATRYNFKLFSNFTFFLEDPLNGDMIEQTDDRRMVGINSTYQFTQTTSSSVNTTTLGGGFRSDDAQVALWKSPNRQREAQLVDADIQERNLSLWAQKEFIFSSLLRLQVGLRGDYFTFNVDDHLEGQPAELPRASGYAQDAILSPKASLVVSPLSSLDLFINAGSGFHSNDARAVVQGNRVRDLKRLYQRQGLSEEAISTELNALQFDPEQASIGTLPRAIGSELGLRFQPVPFVHFSAAVWLLDMDNEFVYVGDGGFTELSGRSRRYGIDLETRATLTPWLSADTDINISRGRLRDEPSDANQIPLAPRLTSTGGLTVLHKSGLEGSLRYIHIGHRPANESGSVTADGYTLFNVFASYPVGPVKLSVVVENVFDIEWNEAQFDTESRLLNEASPVSELHFTPGHPRVIRLGVSYRF